MNPEQRHIARRLLARQARELAECLARCSEDTGALWYQEAVLAHARLTSALSAELKVCPDDETAAMLRKRVAAAATACADNDWVEAHAYYASLRLTLRDLRDEAHADSGKPVREFAYGLICDAMGWTKLSVALTEPALVALDDVLVDAVVAETTDDFLRIRTRLFDGGFNVEPQVHDT